ncbi:LLM class flavin-dependent oxidoreductase [Marivita sp. S6314]|uniref:MupA/Atu3671 family FMN-dependent luciferase-like monooxygenase n=1 Tax=Marivita sp. S6314 TaxID=2926406 RepID=UPI001FF37937|nr:MupA/Atu3671 family FMN-dependent luciferase-like monooxygenase [Marivita sp. S6314]MCK0151700.1 LLM class flavin-dependent oxidoreductase [Marivita sp. S6314]
MTAFDSILIGDESLTQHCAETLLAQGHRIAVLVTGNPEIAKWASSRSIRVEPHGRDLGARMGTVSVDWVLSIANLHILPSDVIKCGRQGAVNFHDGPLPKHAGLNAPVWALLEGESRHGITWHLIEEGVDTGDILVQRSIDITRDDTALTLNTKCYEAALSSFPDLLTELTHGLPNRQPQDASRRSYHGLADRPDANGLLHLEGPADTAERLVRALDHGPYWNPLCTAKIWTGQQLLHIGQAQRLDSSAAPGTVIDVDDHSLTVAFADAALKLTGIRASDRSPLDPSRHVSLGQVLPTLSAQDRTTISDAAQRVAPRDAYWRGVLGASVPITLPFLTSNPPALDRVETAIDARHLRAALAALANRLSDAPGTVLACANPQIAPDDGFRVINPWVPLSPEDLRRDGPDIQVGFATDLPLRDPNLPPLHTPALGISDRVGPIPNVAITFELSNNAVVAHIDTGRIAPDFAQILIHRVHWMASQIGDGKTPDALDPLPPGERRDVLERFNATQNAPAPHKTLHQAFEAQVVQTPDAIALVHERSEITFAALNEHANRVAHRLRDMGVGPNIMVGLHCARGPDLVAAALGILKAGGAYLPLDPDYPRDRLDHYLTDSQAPIVITQSALQDDLPETGAKTLIMDHDPHLAQADSTNPEPTTASEDLAYVIYTSGSTGVPKGVMVEHGNVLNFCVGMDAIVPDREDATWLAVTSLSFDISVLELFYTLSRGIKVVLPSTSQRGVISSGAARTGSDGMDFSIYYWGNDDGVGRDKYRLLLEGAKFADANGFCAVWTPERHFHAFGGPYPNPSVTGAAVAAVTSQIGVRAGSCVAPLHHPARIAEEWAVIDNLTNGRAGLAIASGWQPDDFVLRPENTPPDNKPAMFDAIDQVRKLWRGEPVAFPRKDGQMHEVVTQPRPVSRNLPIWVTTAGNPETWREAGRNGANVLTHLLGQSVDEVAEKIGIYRHALRDAGHNPDDFTITLMLHTCLASTREEARDIAREPMKDYLRSAAGLIKQYAWAFPAFKKPEGVKNAFELNLGDLSEDDLEGILDFAFERYFNDSGLFGTIEDALNRVDQLKNIGVSEIACLIDYGIETDQVLDGLKPLAEVVRQSAPSRDHEDEDFSIAAMLARHNVTHMQCTPSMARMIAMDDDARAQLTGLKHLFLGGEALPGALVADLEQATQATITNLYGPTETTIWSSTERAQADEATVNIGTPIANTQLYVLDDALEPVAIGEDGELWIGGGGVTRGYWNRADLTRDRYRPNPFGPGRLYRTGDLVQRRPDGKLNFLGRTDHQVKLRGFRIELGEIESALQSFSGVTNAVVLAREDAPGDVRLVAYITSRTDADTQALRAHLADRLPDYMIPAHFVTLDAFPVTPNQKIDRSALPAPTKTVSRPKPTKVVAPADGHKADAELQSRIAGIWTEVLGVDKIRPEDNFFDLGGHSLLAVQTHRALRDRLDIAKLSITDIFQFPTLGALSDRVATLGGHALSRGAGSSTVISLPSQDASDRATQRANAMSRRREMRARRRAS